MWLLLVCFALAIVVPIAIMCILMWKDRCCRPELREQTVDFDSFWATPIVGAPTSLPELDREPIASKIPGPTRGNTRVSSQDRPPPAAAAAMMAQMPALQQLPKEITHMTKKY